MKINFAKRNIIFKASLKLITILCLRSSNHDLCLEEDQKKCSPINYLKVSQSTYLFEQCLWPQSSQKLIRRVSYG